MWKICGKTNSCELWLICVVCVLSAQVFAVRKTEVSAILDFARRTLARGPDGLLLYRLIDRSVWTANFQVSPDTDLLSVAVSCPKSTPRG